MIYRSFRAGWVQRVSPSKIQHWKIWSVGNERWGNLQPIDGWFPRWSPSLDTLSTRDTFPQMFQDAWKRPNEQRSSKPTHKRNSSNIEVLETTTTIKTIKNKTKHTEIGRVVQENIPWTTTNTTFQRRDCLRQCDTFNWNYIFM